MGDQTAARHGMQRHRRGTVMRLGSARQQRDRGAAERERASSALSRAAGFGRATTAAAAAGRATGHRRNLTARPWRIFLEKIRPEPATNRTFTRLRRTGKRFAAEASPAANERSTAMIVERLVWQAKFGQGDTIAAAFNRWEPKMREHFGVKGRLLVDLTGP